jgi:hypothetical protein
MPNRIVCGEALWKSNKLAQVEPEWIRPELANLIPLALANGVFEADARKIWAEVYAFNRPSVTLEMAVQILDKFEAAKIIFRWTEPDGKLWGFFVGIDKPGRLPSRSQVKGHYPTGPEVPREKLNTFLRDASATPMPSLSDASATPSAVLGLGSGLGEGEGKGKEESLLPEKRPSLPLAFQGIHIRITEKQDRLLGDAFPWVERQSRYKEMDCWIEANPTRRPRNYSRFAHNWFAKIPAPSSNHSGQRYKEDANGKFNGIGA